MYHKGYCIFCLEPGEHKSVKCRVCGTWCGVKRNITGPHSFAEAVGHGFSTKDVFSCPHAEKKWHENACEMAQEMSETKSGRVKTLIKADIGDLVAKHLGKKPRSRKT